MKRTITRAFAALASLAIVATACGQAASGPTPSVTSTPAAATQTVAPSPSKAVSFAKVGTIDLPTQSASFDVAVVDQATHTLYLADRTNKGVDVIANEKFVKTIGGMVGVGKSSDVSGPNGLVLLPDLKQLWAGDGDSTVKVIDLGSGAVIATVPTGGKSRTDEGDYDAKDKIVMIGNDAEDTPFETFISAADRKVLGKLEIPGASGVEQPAWDSASDMFWLSVPSTKANPGGEIDVIDPVGMKIVKTYPVKDCANTGLAFGPANRLLLVCGQDAVNKLNAKAHMLIVDRTNGSTVADLPVGSGDVAAYDPALNLWFVGCSNMTSDGTKAGTAAPVLAIIDASGNAVRQTLPGAKSAHSVAVDLSNHHVYFPIPSQGIQIIAPTQ